MTVIPSNKPVRDTPCWEEGNNVCDIERFSWHNETIIVAEYDSQDFFRIEKFHVLARYERVVHPRGTDSPVGQDFDLFFASCEKGNFTQNERSELDFSIFEACDDKTMITENVNRANRRTIWYLCPDIVIYNRPDWSKEKTDLRPDRSKDKTDFYLFFSKIEIDEKLFFCSSKFIGFCPSG